MAVHDKLEASLRDLSRTGDTQTCKAARKAADAQLKELSKELKPLLTSLHSSAQSYQIWPKVCHLLAPRNNVLILLYLATFQSNTNLILIISWKCSILFTVCFVMQVEDLITKERELQEKLMTRHSTVVDSFEKKLRGQDVENRIAQQQQKIAALKQEVEYLLEYISEI